ncbi:hypothetical protein DFP72DRAFT_925519 [Ephemerocybe angulata]|uniref:DUF6535 domain-containing protein n=1 Tax=Ephemerocybe angulata TaxID=980116 RepID=A0A8H6HG31_9AGAR|nr:hypothetical protein DFP72DRAFT_925519 [Tulosesus angulatus]
MDAERKRKDGAPYANSDSSAEKAQQNDSNASAPKLPATAKAIITRVEAVLNVQGAPSGSGGIGNKVQEFREDAKIWKCYLEVAELRAREQAELWNSSLDSLMIFAGLFAVWKAGVSSPNRRLKSRQGLDPM